MLTPPRDKAEMYARLARGDFGNTNLAVTSLAAWAAYPDRDKFPLWGFRSLVAGAGYAFDVPRADVPAVAARFPGGFNLSPMVDPHLLFRGDLHDSPTGVELTGVVGRRDVRWRPAFAAHARTWAGSAVGRVLDLFCNDASREDLRELLAAYRGCVVEFTACDRVLGTLPHRNCVVWEVRPADCDGIESGRYEGWRHGLEPVERSHA